MATSSEALYSPSLGDGARDRDDGTVATSELWSILWHRRLVIVGCALLFGLGALIYSILTPSLYTATAEILVDPRDKQVLSGDVNPTAMSPDGGVAQVESQASVVGSSSVLLRAIAATDLTADPEFNGPPTIVDRFNELIGGEIRVDTKDANEVRTVRALKRRLSIKRADKVFVIAVTITAKSPAKAARLANAISDSYLLDQAEARAQSARDASDALSTRLDDLRRTVQSAENRVEQYRAEHHLLSANGVLVSDQQLSEMNNQLSAAQNAAAQAQVRLRQIERLQKAGVSTDGTADALASTVITQLRAREADLVQRSAELRMSAGPRHPDTIANASQLRDVRQLIAQELDRLVRSARADQERALEQERAATDRLDKSKRLAESNDQVSIRLRELQREAESNRTVYASFLLRAQETREQAGVNTTNARVIARAMPPVDRSWPPLSFLVLGALGGGLGLGAGLALVHHYLSPTVLSRAHAERVIGAPVLAVLPGKGSSGKRSARRKAAEGDDGDEAGAALDVALWRLSSAGGASDRFLTLFVTSGRSDKPTRALVGQALSEAAAARGLKVLYFNASAVGDRQPGMQDILRGEASLASATRDRSNSLTVLSRGNYKPGQSLEMLRSGARSFLSEVQQRFDLLVIDGGAATPNPQIAPLLAAVDHVLVVAELGSTRQRDLEEGLDALSVMGRRPTAAILSGGTRRA